MVGNGFHINCQNSWRSNKSFQSDFEYCPFCGRILDIYMSKKEIQTKMQNEKYWLYNDNKHFKQNCQKILNNEGIYYPDSNIYYYLIRETPDELYFKLRHFLRENNFKEYIFAQSGPGHDFREHPLWIKKIKEEI